MTNWEEMLKAAAIAANDGVNPIEKIDHEAKVVEIKRYITNTDLLRAIERAVRQVNPDYRVEQLT